MGPKIVYSPWGFAAQEIAELGFNLSSWFQTFDLMIPYKRYNKDFYFLQLKEISLLLSCKKKIDPFSGVLEVQSFLKIRMGVVFICILGCMFSLILSIPRMFYLTHVYLEKTRFF